MAVINYYEARKNILEKHQKRIERETAFKLSYLTNTELYNEYRSYRLSIEECETESDDVTSDNLIYLCEVALEVASRGLLAYFDRKFTTTVYGQFD